MSTTGTVRVGDVGTLYRAKIQDAGVPFNLSSATEAKLLWQPPTAAPIERPAMISNDGTNWFLNYTVVEPTFHSQAGLWRWQGYVAFADGQRYHTSVETYLVDANVAG